MELAKFVILLEPGLSSRPMCIVNRRWINHSNQTFRYPSNMSRDAIYDRAIDDVDPEESWGTYRFEEILFSAGDNLTPNITD